MPVPLTLVPETRGGLRVHALRGALEYGVDAFVTDRSGGVSTGPYDSLNLGAHVGDRLEHVAENRRRVAAAGGVDLDRLVIVRQVHGRDAVDASLVAPDTCADTMHTERHDLALAILVADCLPVLLFDDVSTRIAVVHAGWRGLDAGVLEGAVTGFPDPPRVRAVIGPSISVDGYQVGPEVAERFAHVKGALRPDGLDHWRLDLRRVAEVQLLERGVDPHHVFATTASTDGGGTFFSDRAQRPCGRFALVARRVLA